MVEGLDQIDYQIGGGDCGHEEEDGGCGCEFAESYEGAQKKEVGDSEKDPDGGKRWEDKQVPVAAG